MQLFSRHSWRRWRGDVALSALRPGELSNRMGTSAELRLRRQSHIPLPAGRLPDVRLDGPKPAPARLSTDAPNQSDADAGRGVRCLAARVFDRNRPSEPEWFSNALSVGPDDLPAQPDGTAGQLLGPEHGPQRRDLWFFGVEHSDGRATIE